MMKKRNVLATAGVITLIGAGLLIGCGSDATDPGDEAGAGGLHAGAGGKVVGGCENLREGQHTKLERLP